MNFIYTLILAFGSIFLSSESQILETLHEDTEIGIRVDEARPPVDWSEEAD